MNKTAIKNFSIWARNKLITDISYRAGLMGITDIGIADPLSQSTDMAEFYDIGTTEPYTVSGTEIKQRRDLVDAIHRKAADSDDYETAYNYIIEEVAYTWFNRLIAVRFMEVNDYLPSHIRVLSSESGKMEPDLVTTPFDADLEFTAEEEKQIISLKRENALDEMFRLLFVKQCNTLNNILPGLFEKTGDYTELLLNLSITDKDGVVYHLVHDIDEADFDIETKDESGNAVGQVEIIGWLYQYYNTEPNDLVYDGSMSKKRISKELLPAATTIYTPDWVVRYMVENSLGRIWEEGHPNDKLKSNWKYYLEDTEQEPEVKAKLTEIRRGYSKLNPEDIKVIDPCMGSGHILCYLFDILMQIYESCGYTKQTAVKSIISNNLYGLDIDKRATQFAYFAVMMKARSYDRHFFGSGIRPNVYEICESNIIGKNLAEYFEGNNLSLKKDFETLLKEFHDAKEYGSILKITSVDFSTLYKRVKETKQEISFYAKAVNDLILPLIRVAEVMTKKYDVVVTNPPYLGSSRFSPALDKYVKENYTKEKTDLSMVMLKKVVQDFSNIDGFIAFITTSSWMYLSSFEKMRNYLFSNLSISSLVDFGTELFDGKVGHNPIVSWVSRNSKIDYNFIAIRLVDYCYSRRNEKKTEFFELRNRYNANQKNFSKIPGSPAVYWASEAIYKDFSGLKLGDVAEIKQGLKTGNNNIFLRLWYEISLDEFSFYGGDKWVPCNKGGEYRTWYGNNDYVLYWENDGYALKNFRHPDGRLKSRPQNLQYMFKEGLTYTNISSSKFGVRYCPKGFAFDAAGSMIFSSQNIYYLLGLLTSSVITKFTSILSPSMSFEVGQISSIPFIWNNHYQIQIVDFVKENISYSKLDWDSFEISWDFQYHPLVRWSKEMGDNAFIVDSMNYYYGHHLTVQSPLELCWLLWQGESSDRFKKIKANEKELNRIFIDIYGLQDELSPEVEDKDVTVRKADLKRDVRSLLSYAVGCIFGRYSLDMDGLAYAGGEWDDSKYTSFQPDADDIIPITDEEYLEDDIVSCLCQWLKVVYGEETLEENLDFIAHALGNKGDSSREIIRNYFLKDFFTDHCKVYQKRPIYWLFDSGKQNSFKALVYLHRYTPDTVGNLRIDYLHRMQRIYDGEINRMQDTIDHSDNSREVTKATKRKEKLQKQLKECQEYDEKISHLALSRIELDLDDGVKVNYEKVQTAQDGKKYQVLAKI